MYQTMNPDNMPSSSTRKSNHFKHSKEDENCSDNGRIACSTNSASINSQQQNHEQDHNHQIGHTQLSNSIIHNQNHTLESNNNNNNFSHNGDVLLQWGQRKRSRCSRTEGRSITSSSDKHQSHIMQPPPQPSSLPSTSGNNGGSSSRTGGPTRVKPNGLLHPKDGSGFLPTKNRNLGDQNQMGCKNSGGGGDGRAISRTSVGKRSPSCNEKISCGSGSIRKVKSDDSLPHTSNGNHHIHMESTHGEHHDNGGHTTTSAIVRSPLTESDKGNIEVVEWPRIYLSLSRKEKEDDFFAMKGTRLPHRPKKRAKAVDRALQYCFPGLWLSDLTRARYEVRERKSTKKPKRRGLKGLENMESESE